MREPTWYMERQVRDTQNQAGRDLGREALCKVILGYTWSRRLAWAMWTLSPTTQLETYGFFL